MRILQVTDLFEPFIGGHGTARQDAVPGTRAARSRGNGRDRAPSRHCGRRGVDGFRIRRILAGPARALAGWYERAEVPFHPPLPDPGVVAALKRIIDELRPDVVHAQGWISYSCLALARRQRFRLVVTLHDHSLACVRKTLMRNGLTPCSGPRLGACLRCAPGQYGAIKGAALTLGLRAARPLHDRVDSWVAISQFVADSSRCAVPRGRPISVIPPTSAQPPPAGSGRPGCLADGYALFVGALGATKGSAGCSTHTPAGASGGRWSLSAPPGRTLRELGLLAWW